MPEDKRPDENMEILSRAIVDAIVKSKDVRKAIRKLSEVDESYAKSFMVLMLKVQNLTDTVGGENPEKTEGGERLDFNLAEQIEEALESEELMDLVDGKAESPNESAFREFLADKFNEEEWLKKLGLKF